MQPRVLSFSLDRTRRALMHRSTFIFWMERKGPPKAMQVHYATLSIRERMKHAKVTGML